MGGPLRVGVVGVGTIGKAHLRAYTAAPDIVEIAGIADISKDALRSTSDEFKVKKTFADYRDLLKLEAVDAVAVCTPPFNHAKITCDAASSGKHVLCEKPMALNSLEAGEMVKVCNKADVKLGMCSARSKFDPSAELAKEYVSKGRLGQVYYARATAIRRRGRPGIDILKDSKWFLDSSKAGGGALIDIGCYDIDLMLYLLGGVQPSSVNAMIFRGVGKRLGLGTVYDVEEHSSIFVRFRDGSAATFETAWASNVNSYRETIIFGSRGALKLDPFTYFTEEDSRSVATSIDFPRETGLAWKRLIEDFAVACLENRQPRTSGEDGLKVMQIIDMAYQSAKFNRPVKIEELQT